MLTASVQSISGVDPEPIRERLAEAPDAPVIGRASGRATRMPALALGSACLGLLAVASSRRSWRKRRTVGLGTVLVGAVVLGAVTYVTGGM